MHANMMHAEVYTIPEGSDTIANPFQEIGIEGLHLHFRHSI